MNKIIEPAFLKANMNKFIIIDCRFKLGEPDYGKCAYEKGHIEGALFLDIEKFLAGPLSEHGGRHPLPDLDTFVKNMEPFGISDSDELVVYDDGDLAGAGRLWWLFKYIGKENVYVLNGGFEKWKTLDYGISLTSIKSQEKTGVLSLNRQNHLLVDMNYVKSKLNNPDVILVDSRASERYFGITEPVDRIGGHIPGAVSFPYLESLENYNAGKDNLKKYFSGLENKEIIVYCGSGVTGSANILFMEEAGLKPRLYAGSYSDWVSYEDNPVEK